MVETVFSFFFWCNVISIDGIKKIPKLIIGVFI